MFFRFNGKDFTEIGGYLLRKFFKKTCPVFGDRVALLFYNTFADFPIGFHLSEVCD